MRENLSKMLTGEVSFDNQDNYVEEIKKLGVDELVELYRIAYRRLQMQTKQNYNISIANIVNMQ